MAAMRKIEEKSTAMGWLSDFLNGRVRFEPNPQRSEPNQGRQESVIHEGHVPSQTSNPKFVVVDLEQGTREWLEWRHNGIGASDASTIMGENRFSSAAALLREKRGPVGEPFENEAMALGKRLEPEARKRFIAKTGKDVRPACLQSTQYHWLRASLDGLTVNHDAVVEIKCGRSAYWSTAKTRSVPDYYYGQLQHIMAVTGLDTLDFWCYWPDNPELLLPVERNDDYIELLLSKELQFWNDVQRDA